MSSGSYLDQIAEKIAYHRRELERLEIAQGVLMELTGKQLAPEPMFTIRKVAAQTETETPGAAKAAASGKQGKRFGKEAEERREKKRIVRERVIAALAKAPGTSGALAERLGLDGEDKDRLYQAVYELSKNSIVEKARDGTLSLSKAAQQAFGQDVKPPSTLADLVKVVRETEVAA